MEDTPNDVLDLDTLEREGSDGPEKPPFRFQIDGKQYELINAEDVDYRDLLIAFRAANSGEFEAALKALLPDDQQEEFFDHDIPAWKLRRLFDQYTKHFGLAPGKSRRSSRR